MPSLNTAHSIRDDLLKQERLRQGEARFQHHKAAAAASSDAGIGIGVIVGGSGSAPPPRCRLPAAYRARMVGWMREVSEALGLHVSTLFAATSLLDRFVAATETLPPEGLLQLLTLACMSVAVKYNETTQLSPSMWLSLAVSPEGKSLYSARDLQRCEFSLLQTVDWRLHQPNTHTFLEHFLMCIPAGAVTPPPSPAPPTAGFSGAYGSSSSGGGSGSCAALGGRRQDAVDCEAPCSVAACDAPPNVFPQVAGGSASGVGGVWIPQAAGPAAIQTAAAAPSWTTTGAPPPQQQQGTAGWLAFLRTSVALAEATLLDEAFLSYDYSAVALACVSLAERVTFGAGGGGGGAAAAAATPTWPPVAGAGAPYADPQTYGRAAVPPAAAAAAAGTVASAACAAAGLPLSLLAPGLAACIRDLEMQYGRQLVAAAAAAAQQMGA
ncbi:hypothetical protein PLESTF_001227600 [Pleodorina starrii]|nr:hypothetical protein PLESTF_001227600 [Pleodorina starrii]